MREIKFRAWDKAVEKYRDWKWINNALMFSSILESENWIVEQFSGLIDKNGKKIYEGDIVFSKIHKPPKMEIRFVEGGFCAFWGDNDYPIDINHFYDSLGCCIEVIGNIHENPELLA